MINVLHIHTLPIISGSGINTFLSMNGMDRRFFKVDLACAPDGRLNELVKENGMDVHTFRNMVQPLNPIRDLGSLVDLTRFLRRKRYHIIHTHNSKAGFIGRLAGTLARVPVIVHTVHGFAFHDQEPIWRRFLFRNLERLASRWCDMIIFISQPLIDWALKERVITNRNRFVKIYSGIDLNSFHSYSEEIKVRERARWGIGREDPVIGIVSKLWEGKGHTVLIEAFRIVKKEFAHAKLVIVGEGYLFDKLIAFVKECNLNDSVIFTGFQSDVSSVISTFDIAALPSFFEGMGRVLLEAMAMGKPVVASNVGGIPDLVIDNVNGILVPPGDVNDLSDTLIKLLKDKKLANRLGSEGRRMVSEKYSAETMVNSILRVYVECLERTQS